MEESDNTERCLFVGGPQHGKYMTVNKGASSWMVVKTKKWCNHVCRKCNEHVDSLQPRYEVLEYRRDRLAMPDYHDGRHQHGWLKTVYVYDVPVESVPGKVKDLLYANFMKSGEYQ